MRDNWYHHWVAGVTLNDQLWHQALVMDRVLELLWGSKQGPNDAMMYDKRRSRELYGWGLEPLALLLLR